MSILGRRDGSSSDFYRTATSARMTEYMLGGSEFYEADRRAAYAVCQRAEWIKKAALINLDFAHRSLRWSLARGVRQVLDLGCGYPGRVYLHEITKTAQTGDPVVYVDSDPGVYGHARTELDEDGVTVVHADLTAMDQLLTCEAVRGAFDLSAPVAVLAHDVLPWCPDDPAVYRAMAILREWMPARSTLSITHLTDFWHDRATMAGVEGAYGSHGLRIRARSHDEISYLFGDFVQQGQGLSATGRWHEQGAYIRHPEWHSGALAGIAVKQEAAATGPAQLRTGT
ncbi:SAM-dependent methyltransferase [Streptomyces sp. NPDC001787]|uniref:SAM-dependent methyltransferase n=1 Tax=Streptomyces sp. NPDC001787 TaxID=3154523 RepID=UPI003317F719